MPTRALLFLMTAVFAISCGGADPLIGSFNFTMAGTETQTAPSSMSSTSSGTGTLAITDGKADKSFVVTVAQTDSNPCTLLGTRSPSNSQTIDVNAGQTCHFVFSLGSVTATITTGTVKLDSAMTVATLAIGYSYEGTSILGNFSGSGVRTYSGPRL